MAIKEINITDIHDVNITKRWKIFGRELFLEVSSGYERSPRWCESMDIYFYAIDEFYFSVFNKKILYNKSGNIFYKKFIKTNRYVNTLIL